MGSPAAIPIDPDLLHGMDPLTGVASGDVRLLRVYVRFTPDSVAKLRPRKNRATLIRRRTLLGKNESLRPWFRFYYCVSTPAK